MPARFGTIRVLLPALLSLVLVTSGCGVADTERRRDTTDPNPGPVRVDQTPAWSPDGSQIVYRHDAGPTEDTTDVSGLYVLNLETDATRLLVEGAARSPDWRPDGERIALTTGNIQTIRPDGSDRRRVTGFGSSFRPRWSPDGRTISFGRSGSADEVGVWFAHLSDSTFTRFGWVAYSDWSPDGKCIVYNFRDQLWSADTSRTDSTQLTANDYVNNRYPAWSPDGRWIAWSALTDDGTFELWIMRADGTGKRKLAEGGRFPAWGPGSDRIVFAKPARTSDRTAIWTIRRDGTDVRQITEPSRNPLN
jgi:TolB protein